MFRLSDSLVVLLMGSDESETRGAETDLKCHLIVEVQNGEDAAVHILRAAQLKEYTEFFCKAKHTHTKSFYSLHLHRSPNNFVGHKTHVQACIRNYAQ